MLEISAVGVELFQLIFVEKEHKFTSAYPYIRLAILGKLCYKKAKCIKFFLFYWEDYLENLIWIEHKMFIFIILFLTA